MRFVPFVCLVPLVLLPACTESRTLGDGGSAADTSLLRPDAPAAPDGGTCAVGALFCDGACTRVGADDRNCGACGNVCPAGSSCAAGACDCLLPRRSCDGVCLDVTRDARNCGACGNSCDAGDRCVRGTCAPPCDGPGYLTCFHDEGGVEVAVCANLNTDEENCGGCGVGCHETGICISGACTCPPGETFCDGVGCVDLRVDGEHCGACGFSCGPDGTCSGSRCTGCGAGLTLCGAPTMCVDVDTTPAHCGSCGRACGAGETCSDGLCDCAPGLNDCGAGCLDLLTSRRDCGTCGNDCGPTGVCTGGTCMCAPGYTACGTSCNDTLRELAHCGGCGMACPPLLGGICRMGTCGCPLGLTACGGACVDTQTTTSNCGTCGNVCPTGFICRMGSCTDAPPTRYEEVVAPASVTFIDACAEPSHATVLMSVDDTESVTTLPFAFRYWATDLPEFAEVHVSSNGYITLDGSFASSLGGSVPDPNTPNAVIAGWWRDLFTRPMGVCIATVGTAPYRQFVVEWNDVMTYSPRSGNITFEIILSETTGTIDIVYGTMSATGTGTVGIEDQIGFDGLNWCGPGASCMPPTGTVIRYSPIP